MDPNSILSSNGLPKMSDIYKNINAPSLGDIGGSLGDKAGTVSAGPTGAFNTYKTSMSGAGDPMNPFSTYKGLLAENGIPQLQKTSENLQGNINDLEERINNVIPQVSANTGNSLVTEGQRQGMVNSQKIPLETALGPLVSNFGTVQNALSTQEQNIGNEVNSVGQNNQLLSDVGKMGVSVAEDNAARQMTGYTADADNVLQGLLKKMDVTGNLDAAEWQTLSTLAQKKQEYQNNLDQISQRNQFQVLSPTQTMVNTLNPDTRNNTFIAKTP